MRYKSQSERRKVLAAKIMSSLPSGASSVLETLDPEIDWLVLARPCDFCKIVFTPNKWEFARFCSIACGTRWNAQFPKFKTRYQSPGWKRAQQALLDFHKSPKGQIHLKSFGKRVNPRGKPETIEKIVATMRKNGTYARILTGGNGKGPTKPQIRLFAVLGPPFQMEYAVSLGKRTGGYPTNYKLDLADPTRKIGIEVNGWTHRGQRQQNLDQKKIGKLTGLGWTVLSFWNEDILNWTNLGMPTESYISTTLKQNGITPLALEEF